MYAFGDLVNWGIGDLVICNFLKQNFRKQK